jgi:1,5-anhydro-D-fructose reductase (1,5-anhydro-D-mannitol-forming)
MNAPPPIRWGLIGASDVASTRMVPALRTQGLDVVAVQSSTAAWALHFATTSGIPSSMTSVDELCNRHDIDAVYVSSTNEKHFNQVMTAINAGKHVLCEKPIALSLAHATAMEEAAQERGVVLAVNHHLPGAATHRTIRRLLREGAIGRPLAVRISHAVLLPKRLRGWRLADQTGGGVVMDIVCHDASAIDALLGRRALEVSALAVRQSQWEDANLPDQLLPPDAVMATIRYEDEVLVQTHAAFTVDCMPTRLEVLGTSGNIVATDVMTQNPTGTVVLRSESGVREIDVGVRRDLYDVVIEAFVGAVVGSGQPTVDGAAGARALAVALAVRDSVENGRAVAVSEF